MSNRPRRQTLVSDEIDVFELFRNYRSVFLNPELDFGLGLDLRIDNEREDPEEAQAKREPKWKRPSAKESKK